MGRQRPQQSRGWVGMSTQTRRSYQLTSSQVDRVKHPFTWPLRALWKAVTITFGGGGYSTDNGNWFLRLADVGGQNGLARYESVKERLDQNAIVMACVQANMTAMGEAPPRVMQRQAGKPAVEKADHPLTRLMANPNPYYPGVNLW